MERPLATLDAARVGGHGPAARGHDRRADRHGPPLYRRRAGGVAMEIGTLFTGIGGFDEAFRRAGAGVRWQCEIDAACRSVLAAHFPGVPCYADVTALD